MCVEALEADQVIQQLRAVARARARERAAERVEVDARGDAASAGGRVAIRAAKARDRQIEAVDEHVGRRDEEVVLAVLRADLPHPGVVEAAGQRSGEAPRVGVVDALDGHAAGADDAADETHVAAIGIVGVARRDRRERRERERRRVVAQRLVVGDVRLDAAFQRVAEHVRELGERAAALLLGHDRVEAAEIERAEADWNRADRARHADRDRGDYLRILCRDGSAVLIGEDRRLSARHGRQPERRLDEVRDAVAVAVESRRPHGTIRGIARQRRHEERAWIARLAQVVGGAGQPPFERRQRLAVEMAERDEHVGIVVAGAVEAVQLHVLLRVVVAALQSELEVEALEVAARNEVDDAGDGFRAVERRRAVLEHLDAFEGDHRRQRGGIHEILAAVRGDGALRLPPTVDQHERRAHAEPAQVHVARAGREVLREGVGVVLRPRVDREVLEHAPDLVGAGRGEVVGRDVDERRRRVELRRPADVRAGDDDFVDAFLARDGHGDCGCREQPRPAKGKRCATHRSLHGFSSRRCCW